MIYMIDFEAVIMSTLIGAPIGCAIWCAVLRYWYYREFKIRKVKRPRIIIKTKNNMGKW